VDIFGIPLNAFFGQLLLGLINGAFYAMLSLGVAVIFGLLRIANFVHGALFMLGAFVSLGLAKLPEMFPNSGIGAIGYWPSLLISFLVVGIVGMLLEKLFFSRIYELDHSYGLVLAVGLALAIEGLFEVMFGSSGLPYDMPESLTGGFRLGFMFLPTYRVWVVAGSLVVCIGTWLVIERTKIGSYLRAATENTLLVRSFGINVPRMLTLTYGFGVALAGLTGALAAPIYQVNAQMGESIIVTVFAVVVIGGMGSIIGSVVAGYLVGLVEGLAKVFYPEATSSVVFALMVLILLARPRGLFGKS
jgi:branched-chain amino acid transport system permease protein